MIRWRALTLKDKSLIDNAAKSLSSPLSDYTFTNLWLWETTRHYEIAEIEGCITIKYWDNYMFPIGFGDPIKAIETCFLETPNLKIKAIPEERVSSLNKLSFPFELTENTQSFDYFYSFDDLLELKGHSYQGKRNQIHQFEGSYDYEYIAIEQNNFPKEYLQKTKAMLEKWFKRHPESEMLKGEKLAIDRLIDDFNALSIIGGLLVVFGEVVACTFGEPIHDDTLLIHIEKADVDYKGSYEMINWLFLKNAPKRAFVNREEALGEENLIAAKKSYHPIKLLKKFTLTQLHESA